MRFRPSTIFALLTGLIALAWATPALAGAASLRWKSGVRLEPVKDGGLSAVSCPSSGFCVAVDQSGNVITSVNPGAGKWSAPVRIDSFGGGLTAISCPTTKLCVAGDANGAVLTSTNPLGGFHAWTRTKIDSAVALDGGTAGITAISCPSAKLCVATDNASPADVLASARPTGGASAWTTTKLGGTLDSVSCTYNTTSCVAAGSAHWWTTTGTGPATAWHNTGGPASGDLIASIACPSLTMCVGAGYGDGSPSEATGTTTPRGAASTWTTVPVGENPPAVGAGLLDSVACASARLCVAVDGSDNAWISGKPATGPWSGGNPIRSKSAAQSTAIACNPKLCVVVDSAGVATAGIIG